jgi:hypothetical protein
MPSIQRLLISEADIGPKRFHPKPDGLVADLHAAFVEQVFHVPEREREPDVHHHC